MSGVVEAIDIHAHYGVFTGQKSARTNRFMTADAADLPAADRRLILRTNAERLLKLRPE